MTTGIITLTSKNQISLPAVYVRNITLGHNRRFTYKQQGNKLILTPEPSLHDALTELRRKWPGQLPALSPKELNQEIRNSYANRDL